MISRLWAREKEDSNGTRPRNVLNVFREKYQESGVETLTTRELADELNLHIRTMQIHVRDLENSGRLVLDTEGKPNHWRLDPNEPREPVYQPEIADARRISNQASNFGSTALLLAFGVLAAAGFVISYHLFARTVGLHIPLLTEIGVAQAAVLAGVVGSSFLILIAFAAYAVAVILPRLIEHRVNQELPDGG